MVWNTKRGYKVYNGGPMFSHKREEWQCMICGTTGPKYEWAQIIGHVAATHQYKSREEYGRWGIPEKGEYYAEVTQKESINIDKVLAFEMELKRIYIKKVDSVWGLHGDVENIHGGAKIIKYKRQYFPKSWMESGRKGKMPVRPEDLPKYGKYGNTYKTTELYERGKRKQEEMRTEIKEAYNHHGGNEAEQEMEEHRTNAFIKMASYYGRIRGDWGGEWACAKCPYARQEGVDGESSSDGSQRGAKRNSKMRKLRKTSRQAENKKHPQLKNDRKEKGPI